MEWYMDNDIKVNGEMKDTFHELISTDGYDGFDEAEVHQQVDLLLKKELLLIAGDDRSESFSILTEYPKTMKNRVGFLWEHMWKRLIICFCVVLAITLILISFVQKANRGLSVQVNEFENLNLTSLLNKVSDIDQKIQNAENEKKSLEAKRAAEIERIENNNSLALKQLSAMNIKNPRLRNQRLQEIQDEYNAELASVEKYNKLIATCNENIRMYTSQRNEFDAGRVQQVEKQKAILNSERFLHEKEKQKIIDDYEGRLEEGRRELKATLEADRERQERIVAQTIEEYDPAVSREQKVQHLMKTASESKVYNGAYINGNSLLLKEGSSEAFRKSLENQRTYYDDISYIASLFDLMPHRVNRAVVSYVNSLRNWANLAGNEMAVSSVNEVNRVIAERNRIEYEKQQIIDEREKEIEEQKLELEEKNRRIEEKNIEIEAIKVEKEREVKNRDAVLEEFLEGLCLEDIGKNKVGGVVFRIDSDVGYEIYVAREFRGIFSDPQYSGYEFACSVYRNGKKIAAGNIELKEDGRFILVNMTAGSGTVVLSGDRIVLNEPKKT